MNSITKLPLSDVQIGLPDLPSVEIKNNISDPSQTEQEGPEIKLDFNFKPLKNGLSKLFSGLSKVVKKASAAMVTNNTQNPLQSEGIPRAEDLSPENFGNKSPENPEELNDLPTFGSPQENPSSPKVEENDFADLGDTTLGLETSKNLIPSSTISLEGSTRTFISTVAKIQLFQYTLICLWIVMFASSYYYSLFESFFCLLALSAISVISFKMFPIFKKFKFAALLLLIVDTLFLGNAFSFAANYRDTLIRTMIICGLARTISMFYTSLKKSILSAKRELKQTVAFALAIHFILGIIVGFYNFNFFFTIIFGCLAGQSSAYMVSFLKERLNRKEEAIKIEDCVVYGVAGNLKGLIKFFGILFIKFGKKLA